LYDWIKQFTKPESECLKEADETRENRRFIAELAPVTEVIDIFKKATAFFARDAKLSKHLSKRTGHYFLFDLCSVF
jgi:transposase